MAAASDSKGAASPPSSCVPFSAAPSRESKWAWSLACILFFILFLSLFNLSV
jgi:hypothetical protein